MMEEIKAQRLANRATCEWVFQLRCPACSASSSSLALLWSDVSSFSNWPFRGRRIQGTTWIEGGFSQAKMAFLLDKNEIKHRRKNGIKNSHSNSYTIFPLDPPHGPWPNLPPKGCAFCKAVASAEKVSTYGRWYLKFLPQLPSGKQT